MTQVAVVRRRRWDVYGNTSITALQPGQHHYTLLCNSLAVQRDTHLSLHFYFRIITSWQFYVNKHLGAGRLVNKHV